jgi:hypothetical protein
MQPKESKSSKHFTYSMIKSFLRIIGCVCLFYNDVAATAVLLAVAEGLGIVEEL